MKTFPDVRIGDVAEVRGGKRLPKGASVQDAPTAYPYLRVVDFGENGINRFNIKFIEEQVHEQISRYKISDQDIYISIAGTIGRVGVVPEDLSGANLTENAAKITTISKRIDKRFLMYFLRGPSGQSAIRNQTGGTSQPKLALYRIEEIRFPCPSLRTQRAIADILSAYDDLIDNNRRRIALLEETARLLYREWFVHFRFPGHEQVKIIDGVPEGWERTVPSRIIANQIGGGWGKHQPQGNEGEPAFVIRGTDLPRVECGDISSVGLRFHSATSLLSRELVPYDIVFEVSGGSSSQPIARTLLLTEERLALWSAHVICASFCKKLTFRTAEDALIFIFHIREHRDRGDVLVYQKESASSLKNFNFDAFMSSYEFSIPPFSLRKLFFGLMDPIVRHQSVLAAQIQQLSQARDLLLPRLMNGEIAV